MLLKDGDPRTGVSARLHHYHEIQNRALNILQNFDRPLAALLCAVMRFGLNDFTRWSEATGFARLDCANAVLGPLAQHTITAIGEAVPKREGQTAQVFTCPVDISTDMVTRVAGQMRELPRWGSPAEDQFGGLAERPSLDSYDRAKMRALWAATALRLGASKSAERALSLLDGDPTFGPWASEQLTSATP